MSAKKQAEKDWRPRLSVDITEAQQLRLQRLLPWGIKNKIFSLLIDEVCNIAEEHGPMAIGLFATKGIELKLKHPGGKDEGSWP